MTSHDVRVKHSKRRDVIIARRDDFPTSRREGGSGVLNPHSVAMFRRDNVTPLGTAGALFIAFLIWFYTSFEHTTFMCLKMKCAN